MTSTTPSALGLAVPDFTVAATEGAFTLSEQRGKSVILYFYPKDSTPGCTTQAQQFRDLHDQLAENNIVVVGISRDSIKSHNKFRSQLGLPFDLISDADEKLCRLFDVIKEKSMYGKKVFGIERSVFLIDKQGVLRQEWRGVKADGSAALALAAAKLL